MGKYKSMLKIAQYGSLTKAAQELGYNQSSLSYSTDQIEEELGVKVFQRDRKGAALTDVGRKLITVMAKIEQMEEDLQQIAVAHRAGVIRIGAFSCVIAQWMLGILERFYQKYPNITVSIEHLEHYTELEEKLEAGTLNCCFFAGEPKPQYEFSPLYQDAYFLVASERCSGWSEEASMQALLEKPFFLPNEGRDPNCPIRPLYQKLSGHDAPFKDLKDDSLILTLVEQDVGISIMPGLLLENVAKGRRIRAIPLEPGAYRTVGILSKRNDDCADCTKAFVQAAREHLSVWQPRLDWQGEAPQSSQIPS